MAVTSTLEKAVVKMLLNNGTDASGNVKTVSVNLGSLSPTGYDDTKAMAVVTAVAACLSKTLYSVQKQMTYTMEAE